MKDIKARYQEGDARAIEEYCDLVLTNSQYPDYFPRNWILQYQSDERMLTIEFELPAPSDLPTVSAYKLDSSTDRIVDITANIRIENDWYFFALFEQAERVAVCRAIGGTCQQRIIG